MKFLTCALAASAIISSAGTAFAACDPGEIVIKFSHIVNTDKHPKGIAASLLMERVNTEMDGKACMEMYPNATLYNDDQVLEAMLQGDVQLAAPSLSKFETFTKQFRIFDLPFMFKNIEAVDEFQNSETGQAMKEGMVRRGLLGLEFWHNGLKQITADRPVQMPEDLEGLKMRVQPAEVIIEQMRALKANPQPMAFPEVYGALQTGVVDGQQNTYSNIYGQKFFEVQDGVTETNHLLLDYMVVTSVDWWDSLPEDVRTQFGTILHEVTVARNGESERVNMEAKQGILDAGGVVRELTEDQRTAWVEAMKPVWAIFEEEVGAENIAAAQEINARH
ncbi:DctP family TRAP transporter solute-binding subunit [Celeribacter sp. PS-C1]|uniref:DctP family TRAP transporter solute-binding subunit n=1 Tax=Celeribacter sp. PS-C1 TaxID=2820813 RepID=UPI0021078495|nr:DctP family TRAP transporter solute-binding subunit [Celeribacter sp. PS-C1]